MAKGHRSQIKRERNAQKDTRPSAKLSYARVSVQKACFVLDAIRGKDVQTALGIVTYNPRYASSLIEKLLKSAPLRRLRSLRRHGRLLSAVYGGRRVGCGRGRLHGDGAPHQTIKRRL